MAIKTYTKGTAVQLSKNFQSTEFDCHGKGCCTETLIDEKLVDYLQKIRDHFNKPTTIAGPYRCPEHNAKVPNAAPNSRHMKGMAADIKVSGISPKDVAEYAESIGVLGIGLYDTDADGHFVHVDTRDYKSFWFGHAQEKRTTFKQDKIIVNTIEIPKEAKEGKMKYSENNKPIVCMQTQSTCYKGTKPMEVKGVLWHSTGANNPTLKRYVQPSDDAPDREEMLELLGVNKYKNDWNHINRNAGLNCWIGKLADGTVATVQTMPWDYRPWGCGSGSKGSCNNGWIQFEICEDDLTNAEYFKTAYAEACQITAYLCKMFNIDPKGTVDYNGIAVPTILCHADSYDFGLGSNHGDVDHWFPKFGKSMETAREDVATLLKNSEPTPEEEKKKPAEIEIYRVRKLWEDTASQIGAYAKLENAKAACDKAGEGYEVYNSNGEVVYPELPNTQPQTFVRGDVVQLTSDATYASGATIPSWVFPMKLYVREIRENDNIVFSTKASGPVTGVVKPEHLVKYVSAEDNKPNQGLAVTPYLVRITADVLNVRAGASTGYKINTQVKKNEIYTIVAEKGAWGKLKSGAGWIHLDYTKKV